MEPGLLIQGGDPQTKGMSAEAVVQAAQSGNPPLGTGGPGHNVDAEFNDTSHKRGVVSMARANDPNSAGSQFFVCVADSKFLDRQYSAFGRVVRGMDVADKIVGGPRNASDLPNNPVHIKKILLSQAKG